MDTSATIAHESFLRLSRLHLVLTILLGCIIWQLLKTKYRAGIRRIPGPLLASISNFDRVWSCARGQQMIYHINLHNKYGSLVRIGPNHVSLADASLIPVIYSIGSSFKKASIPSQGYSSRVHHVLIALKSDFYTLFDVKTIHGWISTTFSIRDETRHRTLKRPVANAYSMSSLKELEPMNDDCSSILVRKLTGLVGQDIDLGRWLHYYAFDVISSITFSNRLGFMEQEKDVENIITAIEGRLKYSSIVGQIPHLHPYLFGNAFVSRLTNLIPSIRILNSSAYIVAFTARQLQRYRNKEFNTVPLKDMLSRFKRSKDDGEQLIDDRTLLMHAAGNIFAGADTTAISLRAIFYHLLRNPSTYLKLLSEIDSADRANKLSDPVTFAEALALPYFQATLKEAMRMHPAVGMLLERVVPAGGLDVGNGVVLPEGTVVGINPWVAARDRKVYGEDVDEFRPERWLEVEGDELRGMERSFLAFGAGARTCLGKNISLLEMSKLVPQLLRKFDFELSDPNKEWEMYDYWFVRQTGLICKVKPRFRE